MLVIANPGRLWSMENMDEAMHCFTILHTTIVEKNDCTDMSEKDVAFINLSEDVQLMWVLLFGAAVPATPGNISAACSVDRFKKDKKEYALMKKLIIRHILMREGVKEEYMELLSPVS